MLTGRLRWRRAFPELKRRLCVTINGEELFDAAAGGGGGAAAGGAAAGSAVARRAEARAAAAARTGSARGGGGGGGGSGGGGATADAQRRLSFASSVLTQAIALAAPQGPVREPPRLHAHTSGGRRHSGSTIRRLPQVHALHSAIHTACEHRAVSRSSALSLALLSVCRASSSLPTSVHPPPPPLSLSPSLPPPPPRPPYPLPPTTISPSRCTKRVSEATAPRAHAAPPPTPTSHRQPEAMHHDELVTEISQCFALFEGQVTQFATLASSTQQAPAARAPRALSPPPLTARPANPCHAAASGCQLKPRTLSFARPPPFVLPLLHSPLTSPYPSTLVRSRGRRSHCSSSGFGKSSPTPPGSTNR